MSAQRQSWDAYFIGIAQQVATRSTCIRKAVGCVLTVDKRIVSTGYNGALPGKPHCTDPDVGCLIIETAYPIQPVFPFELCTHDILLSGCKQCKQPGPEIVKHCIRTVHAETNAIAQAARHGTGIGGGTAYVTSSPCVPCLMNLIAAGIKTCVYLEAYRIDTVLPIARGCIELRQHAG